MARAAGSPLNPHQESRRRYPRYDASAWSFVSLDEILRRKTDNKNRRKRE